MNALPIDLHALPWQTRRIIEAVGYGPALALLRARGGTRVRVPRRGLDCSMLEATLGSIAAVQRFAAAFPDQEYIYLPKAKKIIAQLRNQRLGAERAAGASINTLAMRYDLTASHVKTLIADTEAPPAEPDLFDGC